MMVDHQDHQQPWTLRRALSTAQDLAILAGRPLRKKAVLFVILAISVIWCVLSLVHIHLINRPNRLRVSAKVKETLMIMIISITLSFNFSQTYGDEYDVNSVLDSDGGAEPLNILPPANFGRDSSPHHPSSHDEQFAFLKRQHRLKEDELLAAGGAQGGANHHSDHHSATEDSILGSASGVGGIKCRNSIQGKYLIADDRGYVCPRRSVGINGCCATTNLATNSSSSSTSKTKLYSCETCDQPSGCCSSFEHCISCCMAPQHRELLNRMVSEKKSAVFRIFIANITDYFELCLTKCRTFSGSVQHENTYRNAVAKHCFSDLGL